MSLDAFGRALTRFNGGQRGPRGEGYKLLPDGHFDLDNRKLCNLADPTHPSDAVTLRILNSLTDNLTIQLQKIITQRLREYVDQSIDNLEKWYIAEIDRLSIDIQKIKSELDTLTTKFQNHITSLDIGFMKEYHVTYPRERKSS